MRVILPVRIGIWIFWFLRIWEEEKPAKNPLSEARINNKLNPYMTPGQTRTLRGQTGGRRALSPLRHPCSPICYTKYSVHCDKLRGLVSHLKCRTWPRWKCFDWFPAEWSAEISFLNRISLSTLIWLSRTILERKTSFPLLRKTNGPKTRGCLLKAMNKINESNKHF